MNEKLFLLTDMGHEGSDAIHGLFSTLAKAEQYQFEHHLRGIYQELTQITVDDQKIVAPVPQLLRMAKSLEEKFMQEHPNYKEEQLAQAKWFCDDCQKELTCCWDCTFFHCKCQQNKPS